MSPRAAPEKRATELTLAAYERIAKGGFERLRTRDVANDAGVNVATLHYYFPTKEKLIEAVVGYAMSRFRTALESTGSSKNLLPAYIRGVRKLLADEPELGIVMGELALRSRHDRALARILWGMNEAWHRTVRGLLRRAAREGQISRRLDSDGVAAVIVAVLGSMSLPHPDVRVSQALSQLEEWVTRKE
jgi:AcrR family transcriptional regulator